MEKTWESLTTDLTRVLDALLPEHFVIIEFDAGLSTTNPYVQAAREPNGFYCEVVSEEFLPRAEWPILQRTLIESGWERPSGGGENWHQIVDNLPSPAAQLMLDGLRQGRVCRDPNRIAWRVGRFPPGPDGGEPVPVDATRAPILAA